jgi:hypothetical protein
MKILYIVGALLLLGVSIFFLQNSSVAMSAWINNDKNSNTGIVTNGVSNKVVYVGSLVLACVGIVVSAYVLWTPVRRLGSKILQVDV